MRVTLFSKQSHLQNKLTFYPLFWFTIGLFISFTATVVLIKLYLDNYLMTQIEAYSQQTAKDVTNIIDRDKETISAFLLSDIMRDLGNETRLTIALERLLSQNKNFLEGYVVNLDGQTLVSVSLLKAFPGGQPDFHEQEIYQEAKQGHIGISGWENFIDKNQPYWYMAIPIEKYPGKVIGVLIVTIDLRRIEDTILTSQGAKYGNPVLVDHEGIVLVHLDRSKLGNNWGHLKIIQKVIHGEIGTTNFYDDKGQYVLAAYQPLAPYDWGLIIQVPPGQTIDVIRYRIILLFSLMMIVIFIVTGLLTYVAAGSIVIPIKELTRASQKFGRGERIEYSPVDGNDEIAQLSNAFCEMASSIQNYEKQRAQYISMIAHDLRNPLTSLTEFFKQTSENTPVQDDRISNLRLIKLEQVNRMLNDLLEFSQLDLGQITFNPETVSVRYLCEDVIAGYREQISKFKLLPFSEQICVWADPIRLQQIIQNILDNSLKYTPQESIVTIHCKAHECLNWVEIIISDNGPGFSPEVLANLFQPFQPNPLHKEGSYGLGLAIAKKLALRMNGDLKVESVKGLGATFRILLPKK
jgi:signal transduction histidine kinase